MLVTLTEVKTYLGESTATYDDFLNQQIALYSSAIENYCNRKFLAAAYTQVFYWSDYRDRERNDRLETYHFPLNSITSIKEIVTIDGVDNEATLNAADYRSGSTGRVLKLYDGYPMRWFSNLYGNGRIEIEYNAGYVELPQELRHTIYRLIEKDYNKKVSGIAQDFGDNVQRISIAGTIALDFDYSLQANERNAKFGMLVGNYSNVLDYYRSMRILTGNLDEVYVS